MEQGGARDEPDGGMEKGYGAKCSWHEWGVSPRKFLKNANKGN